MRDHPRQQQVGQRCRSKAYRRRLFGENKGSAARHSCRRERGYLANYRFWLATIAWGFCNIYFLGWATWMPTYFQTARHFSFQAAGCLYSLTFFFALLAIWLVGYYSDRTHAESPVWGGGLVISGIAMFVGGVVIGNPYWALVVLIIASMRRPGGFFDEPCSFPEHRTGTLHGRRRWRCRRSIQLMGVASPTLIGFLVGISGFGAGIVFLAVSGLLSGVFLAFLIKEGY